MSLRERDRSPGKVVLVFGRGIGFSKPWLWWKKQQSKEFEGNKSTAKLLSVALEVLYFYATSHHSKYRAQPEPGPLSLSKSLPFGQQSEVLSTIQAMVFSSLACLFPNMVFLFYLVMEGESNIGRKDGKDAVNLLQRQLIILHLKKNEGGSNSLFFKYGKSLL